MRPQTDVERANDLIAWHGVGRPQRERLPVLSHRDRRMCSVRECYTLAVQEHLEIGLCSEHAKQLECVVSKLKG